MLTYKIFGSVRQAPCDLKRRERAWFMTALSLAVLGTWRRDVGNGGEVRHLIATRLRDLTPLLGDLMTGSRDFR